MTTDDQRARMIREQVRIYTDMLAVFEPKAEAGDRKAQALVKRMRKSLARLEPHVAHGQQVAVNPQVEE
ncbi:hypothetical protein ACQP06_03015 [Nocardia sp. CA-136227]|uniref:hypothetical protein n=1 Tax=Nocardia sp. CA-136227 TaxID=3239979 RepID=UPI003D98412C